MSVSNFEDLKSHVGHKVEVVTYGNDATGAVNASIECEDCGVVLLSYDNEEFFGEIDVTEEIVIK